MFIDMILKTIPRSLRAGVALLVMLVALSAANNALAPLLVPGGDGIGTVLTFVFGFIIGLVAAGYFYYFQSIDGGEPGAHKPLETLNETHIADQRRQRIENAKAAPVFSSHDGEIKPPHQQ